MLSSVYIHVFYQLIYQTNLIHKIKTNFPSLEPTPNPYCPLLKFEIAPTLNTFVELKNQNDKCLFSKSKWNLCQNPYWEREGERGTTFPVLQRYNPIGPPPQSQSFERKRTKDGRARTDFVQGRVCGPDATSFKEIWSLADRRWGPLFCCIRNE